MPFDSCDNLLSLCGRMDKLQVMKNSPDRRETIKTRSILKSRSADAATLIEIKKNLLNDDKCEKEKLRNRETVSEGDEKDENEYYRSDSSNSEKKIKFADDYDCNLVEIRRYIPSADQLDLLANCDFFQKCNRKSFMLKQEAPRNPELAICFKDPYLDLKFMDRLQSQCAVLERCGVRDRLITGIILVRNLEANKIVFARYTTDKWKTNDEINAVYIPNSSNGDTDRFTFSLSLAKTLSELEFAVCYRTSFQEFWDNNEGKNYKVQNILL